MPTPTTRTDLNIVNMALTAMGEDPISNLGTDDFKRAQVMREHYDTVKEAALSRTSWRFATAKASLSLLSGAPTNRWAAAWQLPPDKVRVLYVYPPGRYEIQGRRLYSNETGTLVIDYIRYVEEGDWPPWFARYVVWKLLEATINGITGDDMTPKQTDSLTRAELEALSADSQQQPNQEDLPAPFVDVRY